MTEQPTIQSLPEPSPEILERIGSNLAAIKERMAAAAARSERSNDGARLVAVTKYASDEEVAALYSAGHRAFGESRLQDALPRMDRFPADCEWHMIGHLQRNKAKQAIGPFALIHSVDSERLISKLAEEIEKAGATDPLRLLIQVNVSGEQSKYGCEPDDLQRMLELCRVNSAGRLQPIGLMTMAPNVEKAEATRPYFRKLRKLAEEMGTRGFDLPELSMGMSGDFEIAIEEGATLIRVGSALFA